MKKKIIVFALVLLGVGIFSAVLARASWEEILVILSQITLAKFLIFLGVTQISYALFTLRWQIILKTHGHKVPFMSLWLYRASGYGVSYITPTQVGGEPVRIYYLNENHDIRLSESTASVLLDKLIEITTFLAFVATGVIVISFTNLLPQSSLYLIFGILGGLSALMIYIFKKLYDGTGFLTHLFQNLGFRKIKKLKRFEEKIYKTEKLIMDFLCHTEHKKSTLPLLLFISIVAWSATIVEYFLIAYFLGVTLSAYASFLVATVPLIAYLIPIPGGLGMLEGAQAGMFSVLGYSTSLALAVVLMVRIKEIFFSLIGFIYSLTHGLTLFGKESKKVVKGPSRKKPKKIKIRALRKKIPNKNKSQQGIFSSKY